MGEENVVSKNFDILEERVDNKMDAVGQIVVQEIVALAGFVELEMR